MANEKTPVVWDDTTKKHRPLGTGEKMGGLDASSILSSDAGNLIQSGSDGLAYLSGSGMVDPRADNLLEESAQGKLQVTVDRIAEWLDGHPQDAAVLADAINVVSGDSGNVIVEGSDKGAFLSKGAISAAVAGMTDAQKQQLAEALAAKMAAQLADGKTIVASNGKLTSDPTNATVAQKKAINEALADEDSGLVVDPSTGKLTVDFSNMPTDKFEELLAGLKMQVPLSEDLELHVNTQSSAAGDSIVDGRGTAAKPFKTIHACVNWATGYYALGKYNATILVHPGTYDESVTLPAYNATTGRFTIAASDDAHPPVIRRDSIVANSVRVVTATGGYWNLRRLSLVCNPIDVNTTRNWYSYVLSVSNATVHTYGCEFSIAYYGAASSRVRMWCLNVGDGSLYIDPIATYNTKISCHLGDGHYLYVLDSGDNGSLQWTGSFDTTLAFDVLCSGDFTYFARASAGLMAPAGSGTEFIRFVVESGHTATGTKYRAENGGRIIAPTGGFPGTASSGSVESETYSWYKE